MFVGKGINTKFRMKTITISVISLQFILLSSIIVAPVLGKELLSNNIDSNKSMKKNVKSLSVTEFFNNNTRRTTVIPFTNQSTTPITKITTTTTVNPFINRTTLPITNFGMWAPYQLPLESIKNITEQKNAINAILKQGYNEYYFTMANFRSKAARSMTENLLQSADGTKLKIIIILLPPSEAGPKGNFD
jgi:hypothetical protein